MGPDEPEPCRTIAKIFAVLSKIRWQGPDLDEPEPYKTFYDFLPF
jgi:hypothetical protein